MKINEIKVVSLGRTPIVGSPLQQWVDDSLVAKYGPLLHKNGNATESKIPMHTSQKETNSSTQSTLRK